MEMLPGQDCFAYVSAALAEYHGVFPVFVVECNSKLWFIKGGRI